MKKVIVLSVIVLFAVAAFAQTHTKNGHGKEVSSNAKETILQNKEKGQAVSDLAKNKDADELNNDIKLSKEEKQARKAARQAENDTRKEGRVKDGSDDRLNDLDKDGTISPEEKEARKTARRAENDARKANRIEDDNDRLDDLDKDGTLSREEKEARKAARRTENNARKADREDDGILNGSANDNNVHGKTVSGMARETTLESREKGAAVSGAASSKARNTERVKATTGIKANGAGKPAGVRKKMGSGHFGRLK